MAADSRSPRDGKHLEILGYYNPLPALGTCSTPSFPIRLVTPTTNAGNARKGGPRDTRPVDPMTGRIITPEKTTSAESQLDPKDDEVVQEENASSS